MTFESNVTYLRESLAKLSGVGEASEIWASHRRLFHYLFELSPDSLRSIRYHTGIINGIQSGAWWYSGQHSKHQALEEARQIGYVDAVKDVPEKFWLSEPQAEWSAYPRPPGCQLPGAHRQP